MRELTRLKDGRVVKEGGFLGVSYAVQTNGLEKYGYTILNEYEDEARVSNGFPWNSALDAEELARDSIIEDLDAQGKLADAAASWVEEVRGMNQGGEPCNLYLADAVALVAFLGPIYGMQNSVLGNVAAAMQDRP